MAQGQLHPGFQRELSQLLNKYSLDNACNTPDFMLAGMLTEQLETYRRVTEANIHWHEPAPIGQAASITVNLPGPDRTT